MSAPQIPVGVKVWIQVEAVVLVFFTAFGLRWSIGWWVEDPPVSFADAVFFGIGATAVTFLVHFGGRAACVLSYAALGAIAILGGIRHGTALFGNAESVREMLAWEAVPAWAKTALYLLGAAILLLSVYRTFVTELWGWTSAFDSTQNSGKDASGSVASGS